MPEVMQITVVEVPSSVQGEALAVMRERAEFMAEQPGFLSIQLFRSLDEKRIVNLIRWDNWELLKSAHASPEFRKEWDRFDQLTESIDPHLYELFEQMEAG